MSNKKPGRIKGTFRKVFQFRFWLDAERLQGFGSYLASVFKSLFVLQRKEGAESFDEAAVRLTLNEEDLLKRQRGLFYLTLFMLFLVTLLFAYVIYQVMYGTFAGVLVSLVVMLIACALAFRYHFWFFQIKSKQLGCSVRTWFKEGVLGGDKE